MGITVREKFPHLSRVAALALFRRLTFPCDLARVPEIREGALADVCDK
jgi:hypothetical protein